MARISVVGSGYVGLVTGACFADLGNAVTCIDVDEDKVKALRRGRVPIYEPGLEELVKRNARGRRLRFTSDYGEGLRQAEFIFIAVNTPSGSNGEADMAQVRSASRSVARELRNSAVIVNKSTMPIGSGDWVANFMKRVRPDLEVAVVSNPETLREGSAVADFLNPDRVILGSTERAAAAAVAQLYRPLNCPILTTDLRTAEMIKYASNAFLATKISFINEIAGICERLGADVREVARGMGLDRRIGAAFLEAGVGYGGSCFPKDVKALEYMAAVNGCHPQLLRAVIEINRDARRAVVQKLRSVLGELEDSQIGVLGLSFKPNTDDLREAPALEIIHLLQNQGARIKAYDPVAMERAASILRDVEFCSDAYAAARDSHALVLVTDWSEFRGLDMPKVRRLMRYPFLLDGRNVYNPSEMARLGFSYIGIGRPAHLMEQDAMDLPSAAKGRSLTLAGDSVARIA